MLTTLAFDLSPLFTWENGVALLTLTALEIVLGIDNIVFIAILCGRLPEQQRARARTTGLSLAVITRIALLATITWVIRLAGTPLFPLPFLTELVEHPDGTTSRVPAVVSGKDLILLLGGLFLLVKATLEIHHKIEGRHGSHGPGVRAASFWKVIGQILLIDLVFSLDSVITAVGMARSIEVMITAVVIAVAVMILFAGMVSAFIERHPTLKMLALAFLILIGVLLIAEGLGQHFPRGYVYFAMTFALGVEVLNIIAIRSRTSSGAPA
jgi:predicted tellurium resistance membrane protein TerC